MPSLTWTITYDKTTPESAEDGEYSDSGFWMPGGWEYSTADAPTGPAFVEWCQRMGPFEITGTVRELVHTLDSFGGIEDNGVGTFYEVDADQDYRTGEDTRRALHLEGVSARNLDRIRRVLRARKVLR